MCFARSSSVPRTLALIPGPPTASHGTSSVQPEAVVFAHLWRLKVPSEVRSHCTAHDALHRDTRGVKDSRENVQANATEFFKQCKILQNEGLVFDRALQTFLGRSKAFSASELSEEEKLAEEKALAAPDQKRYFPVKIRFWFPADMAAQCGV